MSMPGKWRNAGRRVPVLVLAGMLAAVVIPGCETPGSTGGTDRAPTPAEVAQARGETDIVNVVALYDSVNPWIWTEDRSRVHGIRINALYLFGPNDKAVFGEGVIRPKLYVMEKGDDGKKKAVLKREWSFDVDEALLLRAKKETAWGWGYWLPLDWGDLDVSGREIRMVIAFERRDGFVVKSSNKHFPVPLAGS